MTLAELKPGARATVRGFTEALNQQNPLSARLMEMGLTVGSELEVAFEAPFGGGLAVRCRGSLIALRLSDARNVEVTAS